MPSTPAPPPVKAKSARPAPPPRMPPPAVKTQAPVHVAKTFTTSAWTGDGEGQKTIIYGASGKGKTNLASTAPNPVFFGLDDGGRMIRNPITGEPIQRVPGVETFQDVRDALQQPGLFTGFKTVVIDTGTALELMAIQHVITTIPHEKSGTPIKGLDDYGYGKGYIHLFDTMRLIFQDLDALIRQGKNVVILCQQCPVVIANPSGGNYLQDGPKLYAPGPDSKQSFTIRGFACEWADHVLRLDYQAQQVVNSRTDREGKEHAGKVVGNTTRAIFTQPQDPSYFAKTRTLTEPVISFSDPADDSLWRFMFAEEYA